MSSNHTRWEDFRREQTVKRDPEALAAAYAEADFAIRLGEAVYKRRKDLGLSQVDLAQRAGMTQPQVSRLEAGGPLPTLSTLERLAEALEVRLVLQLGTPAAHVTELQVPAIAA